MDAAARGRGEGRRATGLLAHHYRFPGNRHLPEDPHPGTVGLVAWAGPVIGDDAPTPGSLATPLPPAVFVLHPPSETVPSTPENDGVASGAILLPGVPHLGLSHRAGWVEADIDGTVTKLLSGVDIDPVDDPDLAVLATLCAA